MSVVVRVRDDAVALQKVLTALAGQQLDVAVEVVVLDSTSQDGSADIAAAAGARVFSLPRRHVGDGRALNLGIELCRGDVVVLLSAHAVPTTTSWLRLLVAPVLAGSADAAFCRQVPVGAASRVGRHRFAGFSDGAAYLDREGLVAACRTGRDPYEVARFSNAACAVSRAVAARQPFRDLPYAEDRAFAVDVTMAGGRVAYLPGPAVSYDRPTTLRSAYHVARRAQLSKRLVRELSATYTGHRWSGSRETASRTLRAALVPAAVAVRLMLSLLEPREVHLGSAVHDVVCAGAATLGLAHGCYGWRRSVAALDVDRGGLAAARARCRAYRAAAGVDSRTVPWPT